jgi:hypothetical protein
MSGGQTNESIKELIASVLPRAPLGSLNTKSNATNWEPIPRLPACRFMVSASRVRSSEPQSAFKDQSSLERDQVRSQVGGLYPGRFCLMFGMRGSDCRGSRAYISYSITSQPPDRAVKGLHLVYGRTLYESFNFDLWFPGKNLDHRVFHNGRKIEADFLFVIN